MALLHQHSRNTSPIYEAVKMLSSSSVFRQDGEAGYLLCVTLGVWQLGGHVEHDLLVSEVVVHRLCASLPMCHVQTPTETRTKIRRFLQSKLVKQQAPEIQQMAFRQSPTALKAGTPNLANILQTVAHSFKSKAILEVFLAVCF